MVDKKSPDPWTPPTPITFENFGDAYMGEPARNIAKGGWDLKKLILVGGVRERPSLVSPYQDTPLPPVGGT